MYKICENKVKSVKIKKINTGKMKYTIVSKFNIKLKFRIIRIIIKRYLLE